MARASARVARNACQVEEGLDMPVEKPLDLFGQDLVGGFLAQEHQELPNHLVDQAAPFGSGLARLLGVAGFVSGKPNLSDNGVPRRRWPVRG